MYCSNAAIKLHVKFLLSCGPRYLWSSEALYRLEEVVGQGQIWFWRYSRVPPIANEAHDRFVLVTLLPSTADILQM
jgi:hypothetical protein